jgi:hypothetical protein
MLNRFLRITLPQALAVFASLAAAQAAPPAGKPVFIQVQGLAPTSVGLNGFVTAGDFTEGGGFFWMPTSGVTLIGGESRADAVSADGRVIVGYEEATSGPVAINGAKWVDGREEIIRGPLGPVGFAKAVNRDGSLIAGTACTPDLSNVAPNAFAWTAAGGVRCYPVEAPRWVPWIGPLNTLYNVCIRAVSDDGRVMGGDIEFDTAKGEEESVVWFDGEPVFLRDYLRSNGYPDAFEGHANTGRITGISPDGRTIVGHNGGPFGAINRYAFVVVLPELGKR